MKILYIACGGFGDVSWTTSWPRVFSKSGHKIDIFLIKYTGNPFHINPYITNLFIMNGHYAGGDSIDMIEKMDLNNYDIILLPNIIFFEKEYPDFLRVLKSVKGFYSGWSPQIPGIAVPPMTKPEFYFSDKELDYVNRHYNSEAILFFPLSSAITTAGIKEETRTIHFDLIKDCAQHMGNVIMIHGGQRGSSASRPQNKNYLPIEELEKMESLGIKILYENYNCFDDESGTVLGKQLALVSRCSVSVHSYSGSICMSMGYNKPYVVIVPEENLRHNTSASYQSSLKCFEFYMKRADAFSCLKPSAWCITNKSNDIIDAINSVKQGKTGIFNKEWSSI
jgi:hypothetical protein